MGYITPVAITLVCVVEAGLALPGIAVATQPLLRALRPASIAARHHTARSTVSEDTTAPTASNSDLLSEKEISEYFHK